VRCPGCENLHLVADRLGWFDEESVDIEKIMKEKGETVQVFTQENVLELTNNHVTTGITPATCTPITITDG
jgi:hypothetical protein